MHAYITLHYITLHGITWHYMALHGITLHTYTHAYTHIHTHTHIHTLTYTHIHTYRHTYIHTYAHTYAHTYRYVYNCCFMPTCKVLHAHMHDHACHSIPMMFPQKRVGFVPHVWGSLVWFKFFFQSFMSGMKFLPCRKSTFRYGKSMENPPFIDDPGRPLVFHIFSMFITGQPKVGKLSRIGELF